MEETVRFPRLIRFGTFELDLQSGELRKGGLKLKLTGLPFQVLAILLEHPGAVVTREELQKRLWPDTFVDVDHNLNTSINKIREVLGDSAESPRFVETLPRRGYRFIAPIDGMSSPATQGEGSDGGAQVPRQFRALRLSILIGVSAILAAATFLISSRASRRLPRVTASTQLSFSGRILGPLFPPPLMIYPLAALATDGNRVYFSASSGFTLQAGVRIDRRRGHSFHGRSAGGGTSEHFSRWRDASRLRIDRSKRGKPLMARPDCRWWASQAGCNRWSRRCLVAGWPSHCLRRWK